MRKQFLALRSRLGEIQASPRYQIVFLVLVIWTLFSRDFLMAALPRSCDVGFFVVSALAFFAFAFDFLISCVLVTADPAKRLRKVTFWLDLVNVLALVLSNPLLVGHRLANLFGFAKAGAAARAGTRAGRFSRVLRLAKLWAARGAPNLLGGGSRENITEKMQEAASSGLVLFTLCLVVIIGFLDVEAPRIDAAPLLLQVMERQANATESSLASLLEGYRGPAIVRLEVSGLLVRHNTERLSKLRFDVETLTRTSPSRASLAVFDVKKEAQLAAGKSLAFTVLLIVWLLLSTTYVTKKMAKMMRPLEQKKEAEKQGAGPRAVELSDFRAQSTFVRE